MPRNIMLETVLENKDGARTLRARRAVTGWHNYGEIDDWLWKATTGCMMGAALVDKKGEIGYYPWGWHYKSYQCDPDPEPVCPECNSQQVVGPDDEGVFDCLDCGVFWPVGGNDNA